MIDQIKQLYDRYNRLSTQPNPSMAELKTALEEIKNLTSSKEFKSGVQDGTIDFEFAGKLKRLQDLLKEKIDEFDYQENSSSENSNQAKSKAGTAKSTVNETASFHEHDSAAKNLMEEADDLYWKGKWKEAYELYEQVLRIEPDWPRAKEYSQKAKYNYDNKAGIPKTAIPDSVKFPFARAESALSRWEVDNAKIFVENAQSESTKLGLGKWDELDELVYRVENYLDIHNSFQSAIALPDTQIDEAIEKIEAAYEQSRRPLYGAKLEELKQRKAQNIFDEGVKLFKLGKVDEAIRKLNDASSQQSDNTFFVETGSEFAKYKEAIQEIGRYLDSPKIVFTHFIEIENRFKFVHNVLAKYPDSAKNHTAVKELMGRFEVQKPLVLSDLKNNLSAVERRYENATKLEDAEMAHAEGDELLNLLAHIGADSNDVKRFTDRRDNRQIEIEAFANDIATISQQITQKKKFSSKDEADRASEILDRFPNDLRAKKFQKTLKDNQLQRRIITSGIAVLVIGLLSMVTILSLNAWNNYVIALTPTATLTLTPTPTPTFTPTSTATITPIPSATPLPPQMRVTRDLNAKSGCYEDYRVVGEIRVGSIVNLLQSDRKFDNVGRECVLVEFQGTKESVVGWVLLVDLAGATP